MARTVAGMVIPPRDPVLRRRSRPALVSVMVVLAACLPIPGAGWDGQAPSVPPHQDAGPGLQEAQADAVPCRDPRVGPLPEERVPIDRTVAAASAPAAPLLVRIDPSESLVLSLGPEGPAGCVAQVVLATAGSAALRTAAAAHAVIEGVPLVLVLAADHESERGRGLAARLARLGVTEVVSYGPLPAWAGAFRARVLDPDDADSRPLDLPLALLAASGAMSGQDGGPPPGRVGLVLVAASDVAAQADVVAHAADGAIPVVIPSSDASAAALRSAIVALGPRVVVSWSASTGAEADAVQVFLAGLELPRWDAPAVASREPELWLGDVGDAHAALLGAVIAAARGAAFVAVDGEDLRRGTYRTTRLRSGAEHPDGPVEVVLVGDRSEHAGWQLDTVLTGTPLPEGGFLPLEDRRIVALYGSPDAPSLGLLGEQDDVATIARAIAFAERYADAADGRMVTPGLDVIATIASSAPEPTGDYSRRVPIERLRSLVELAGEAGVAVLLDLQPGRTSFLAQAKEYEELLREPHVHLALDPEWRLGPTERHLVRIGSVPAEEVQEVVDWLARLVRQGRLPQKVLLLHQFTEEMLPDRERITIPPELAGVIHVDGQGPLATKDRTYAVLSGGAGAQWGWGWKNFTRIDVPVATPQQSLDRAPVPVVITYQ